LKENTFQSRFKDWFPVFFWMFIIFWMSTGSFSAQNTSRIIEPVLHFLMPWASAHIIEMLHNVIRKCGHFVEYFILGLLLFRSFRSKSGEFGIWRRILYSAIIVVLYAFSDELHQSFVCTRTASVIDVGIDTVGGIFAQAVSFLGHHIDRNKLLSLQSSHN
jgi:VanZ family protein